jgi:hypothetical protein
MRGFIGILIVGLLSIPTGILQAQVAVPTFNPARPNGTSLNPAAQQWGAPSRIAVGMVQETEKKTPGNPLNPDSEYAAHGAFVIGRYVGESWAIGAEGAGAESELTDPDTWNQTTDVGETEVALSGLIGDTLAVGLGARTTVLTDETKVGVLSSKVEATSSLPVAGLSLRLWESLFLGAVYGNETLSIDLNGVNVVEESRPVTRYGIGVRFGDEANGLRAEYGVETRDPIEFEVSPGVFIDAEASTANRAALELKVANILVGYEVTTSQEDDFGDDIERTESLVSLGWVPMAGLAVTASTSTKTKNNTTTDDESTFTGTIVGIAWMF